MGFDWREMTCNKCSSRSSCMHINLWAWCRWCTWCSCRKLWTVYENVSLLQLSHSRLFKQIKLTPPYAEVQQHGLGCDGYVRDVDIVREETGRIFVRVWWVTTGWSQGVAQQVLDTYRGTVSGPVSPYRWWLMTHVSSAVSTMLWPCVTNANAIANVAHLGI